MRTFICITLVLALLATAYCQTKCYVCSGIEGTCGDAYAGSSDHETDCKATGYTDDGGCSKLKNKTKLFGTWIITVTRSCAEIYDNGHCSHGDRLSIDILGIKSDTWSCSCTGDLCNGGSQLAVSSALIMAALAKYLF